uniref:Uncharacterized protein n=1 Tax=Anguilla anguilla TaxID=7936 RepID=A0A0E9X7F9_ANGAN
MNLGISGFFIIQIPCTVNPALLLISFFFATTFLSQNCIPPLGYNLLWKECLNSCQPCECLPEVSLHITLYHLCVW